MLKKTFIEKHPLKMTKPISDVVKKIPTYNKNSKRGKRPLINTHQLTMTKPISDDAKI